MKKILLLTILLVCGIVTTKAQVTTSPRYEKATRIIDGYFVGKLGNDISSTPMSLKVEYEFDSFGAKRNVRVIAFSPNGIDFNYPTRQSACSISEEWSNYMAKRSKYPGFVVSYYKADSWESDNNQSIDNFYLFSRNQLQ